MAAASGGSRPGPRVWTLSIGLLLLAAQPARTQEGTPVATGELGSLSLRDERLRQRFRDLLLAPARDLAAGWQLAVDLGRPAAPLLWELLQKETFVDHRLVLLAAALFAGGSHEDRRLFEFLDQQKPMLEERTLAALQVALGPAHPRPVPNFWSRFFGGAKTPEDLLAIAVRLASVRFPGTEEGAPVLTDDDPGLAAATAFAGLPVPPSVLAKLWNLTARERHAELFWRGALLGAARRVPLTKPPPELLDRARRLMRMPGDDMAATRGAATWLRAVADDLQAEGTRLDSSLLQIAAGHRGTAAQLRAWFEPQAQPRDEQPQRLAVAYALSADPRTVIAQRAQWADPRIQRHVAVALAWRLCAGAAPETPVDVVVPGLPEWAFVRAAAGARFEVDAACDDPVLQAALPLLADGRLDRNALQNLLEETLWRWGSHPQCAPWELERLLARDLLLVGSNPGGAKYQTHIPLNVRYIPGGKDRNDSFFTVAVALFEFAWRPRAGLPAECRLSK